MNNGLLSAKELNTIRGRIDAGKISISDAEKLIDHIDTLEEKMAEVEVDDFFGTEGYRHFFGYPDSD